MAMELFSLKNKFDEQTKELISAKREGEAKERDFKVCSQMRGEDRYQTAIISNITRMVVSYGRRHLFGTVGDIQDLANDAFLE